MWKFFFFILELLIHFVYWDVLSLISAMSNPSGPLWPASQAGVLIETLPLLEILFIKQNLKMTKYLKQSLVYRCRDGNVSKPND